MPGLGLNSKAVRSSTSMNYSIRLILYSYALMVNKVPATRVGASVACARRPSSHVAHVGWLQVGRNSNHTNDETGCVSTSSLVSLSPDSPRSPVIPVVPRRIAHRGRKSASVRTYARYFVLRCKKYTSYPLQVQPPRRGYCIRLMSCKMHGKLHRSEVLTFVPMQGLMQGKTGLGRDECHSANCRNPGGDW